MLGANFVFGMKNLQKATSLFPKGIVTNFFKRHLQKIINYLFLYYGHNNNYY
jgi:hypothetical protein